MLGKKAGHAMCGGYIHGMSGFFFTEGPVYTLGMQRKVVLLGMSDSTGEC